jgi:hypothetical protein
MKDVREVLGYRESKKAWVWTSDRKSWEFHYGDFYDYFHASDAYEARAKSSKRFTAQMKTYQNTFESLGDPVPISMESAREYAKEFLPMFVLDEDKTPGRWYRIDAQVGYTRTRTGSAKELQWWDRLYDECEHKQPYDWDPGCWSGLISEERLLDFLEQAVEEVKEVVE